MSLDTDSDDDPAGGGPAGRLVEIGFAITAAALAISAALTYRNLRTIVANDRMVAHSREVMDVLEGALSSLKDAETGYRGFHITGEPSYLKPYEDALSEVPRRLDRLGALTAEDADQGRRVAALRGRAATVLGHLKRGVEIRRDEGFEASRDYIRSGTGKAGMDVARALVTEMIRVEQGLLEGQAADSDRSYSLAVLTTLTSALLGLGLVGISYALVDRDRRRRGRAAAAVRLTNDALEARVRERTAELTRQQIFQGALLENVNDGIVACDAEGRLTLSNRATREFYGLPSWPIPAEQWSAHYDLFDADGVTPLRTEDLPLYRALRGESVRDVEMVIVPKSGERRTLLANGRAFADAAGTSLGAVVSMRDVTEQKRAEEERRLFTRRLEESNRELEEFATVASHDLQEPLRKIQAFSGRLRDECGAALDGRGGDFLNRVESAAGRMRTLIDDLLTYSRVGRKGRPFVPVDLARIAEDVVADLEGRLREVGGRVEIGPLPTVDADPTQARQLLQNLIANALKFRHPDRPPAVHVEGRTLEDGTREVVVRDNGIGFEPVYAERIFQMFQRLHGRHQYDGNGIGLAICRKIVERHDGRITAEGSPGEGASFTVTLPVRQNQSEPVPSE